MSVWFSFSEKIQKNSASFFDTYCRYALSALNTNGAKCEKHLALGFIA
jgi:hypothetical protein